MVVWRPLQAESHAALPGPAPEVCWCAALLHCTALALHGTARHVRPVTAIPSRQLGMQVTGSTPAHALRCQDAVTAAAEFQPSSAVQGASGGTILYSTRGEEHGARPWNGCTMYSRTPVYHKQVVIQTTTEEGLEMGTVSQCSSRTETSTGSRRYCSNTARRGEAAPSRTGADTAIWTTAQLRGPAPATP